MPLNIDLEQNGDGRWRAAVSNLPGVRVCEESWRAALLRVQASALRAIADQLEHGEVSLDAQDFFTLPQNVPGLTDQVAVDERPLNLDDSPTPAQLRELLVRADDQAGSHLLWVSDVGGVILATVPRPFSKSDFLSRHPEARVVVGPFLPGRACVGLKAAQDDGWVQALFDLLRNHWQQVRGTARVAIVERF